MSDQMPIFPRGSIAMDNGDLIQVINVKVDQEKVGTKILHTIRKEGAGIVIGNEETKVSFDYVIPETGAERDYMKLVRTGKVKKLRFKVPGETFAVVGIGYKRGLEIPMDDAVKGSVEFMGKTEI